MTIPPSTLPPFPPELDVYDLPTLDYASLAAGDPNAVEALWSAATKKGFWYLKSSATPELIESMFEVGKATLALPFGDKMRFWQGNDGGSFGYKSAGATTVDPASGAKDNAEFINISKDDALAYPEVMHMKYPEPVNSRMDDTVKPYISMCADITRTIFSVFENKLGLPDGTLSDVIHSQKEASVSETRYIKVPPTPGESKIAVGAHTDFGSLSLLINKLGGLQLLPEGSTEWKYVKPRPGHFICNIGDALNLLSGGILKSSIHRVVSPPLSQSLYERSSLVFFTRPGNSVLLNALVDESAIIAAAAAAAPPDRYHTGVTAAEWFARRQSKWRVANQKGVVDYLASRGTEHTQSVV